MTISVLAAVILGLTVISEPQCCLISKSVKHIVCSQGLIDRRRRDDVAYLVTVMEAIIMIMAVVVIRLSVVCYVVMSDHDCSIMDKITTLSNNLGLQT